MTGSVRRLPPRTWAAGCAGAVAAAACALLLGPSTAPAADHAFGDRELAHRVLDLLPPDAAVGVSVAVLEQGRVRQAAVGTVDGSAPVALSTPFESGSVTKTLTATLLADMAVSGDITLDTTLVQAWPEHDFADGTVAGITVEQLATHTSGLPRVVPGARSAAASAGHQFLGVDPYAFSPDPVASVVGMSGEALEDPGRFGYSNLGYAVLGHTLARVEGTDFSTLLRDRVLEPLGMEEGTAVSAPPPGGALPYRVPPVRVEPWSDPGIAPAGGVWTTSGDMARFLQAAMEAQDPRTELTHAPRAPGSPGSRHDARQGLGWSLWEADGVRVAQHLGMTGGSTAYVAHTDDGRGVAVLANTAGLDLEEVGLRLIGVSPESPGGGPDPVRLVGTGLGVFFGAVMPLLLVLGWLGARGGAPDRLGALAWFGEVVLVWAIALRVGAWDVLPLSLWYAGAGLIGLAAVLAAPRLRGMPWVGGDRPRLRAVFLVVRTAGYAGVLALLPAIALWRF